MQYERELLNRAATRTLAKQLAAHVQPGDVLLLSGPLGVGKTQLAADLIHALGVPASVPVTSPTFSLVHEYTGRLLILHADLYRLGDLPEDLTQHDLPEAQRRGAALVIEWGDHLQSAFAAHALSVRLAFGAKKNQRRVQLRASGSRPKAILTRLLNEPG